MIDSHVHIISSDPERYPLMSAFGDDAGHAQVESFSAEDLLGAQRDCSVEAAVLVQSFAAYAYDNRYAADMAEAHPDRFVFVAGVDPESPELRDQARHWVEERGARGLRALAFSQDLDPESFRPLWQLAADLQTTLCVLAPIANLERLTPLMRDFPSLPVVLDHCGLQSLDSAKPDLGCPSLCALSELPALHLKISSRVFDASRGSAREAMARLEERFGADRLLWGSDYPASPAPSYARAIAVAREILADFGAAECDRILAHTSRRLFRIAESNHQGDHSNGS